MSFADKAEFDAFVHKDHYLPQMSPKAVAKSLESFSLTLQHGRDSAWLAMATRRALGITMRHVEDGPERTSNAEIRAELERLSGIAGAAWRELFGCGHAAENHIWRYAWRHWDGEGGTEIGNGLIMGDPSMHKRFRAAIQELDWLAGFMQEAARETESQRGPWRSKDLKRLRIERAQYLAPIFEAAYGEPVSANNWPSGVHKKPSSFMDFYQRMVAIAFDERKTSNLSGVLKIACKLHREQPVQFCEGVIPGL